METSNYYISKTVDFAFVFAIIQIYVLPKIHEQNLRVWEELICIFGRVTISGGNDGNTILQLKKIGRVFQGRVRGPILR